MSLESWLKQRVADSQYYEDNAITDLDEWHWRGARRAYLDVLDHLESDPLLCQKCGGEVSPENVYADDLTWSCEKCGTLHNVKDIRTCALAPEEEEEDE